jgi:hypothetical protein
VITITSNGCKPLEVGASLLLQLYYQFFLWYLVAIHRFGSVSQFNLSNNSIFFVFILLFYSLFIVFGYFNPFIEHVFN